jgi:hypothetical protein
MTGPDPLGVPSGMLVLLLRFMRYTGANHYPIPSVSAVGRSGLSCILASETYLPHGEAAVCSEEGKCLLPSVSGYHACLLLHGGLSTVPTRYEPAPAENSLSQGRLDSER